jgi:proline iminopeptidase
MKNLVSTDLRKRELDYWPFIKPFVEWMLSVSKLHTIHYALYGNPICEPVFFLHGGPGCGCTDDDTRWFDPKKISNYSS